VGDAVKIYLKETGLETLDGFIWFRMRSIADNGPSDSIKGWKYFNYLSDYQLLKNASALWT
jgi:hypothetical protein